MIILPSELKRNNVFLVDVTYRCKLNSQSHTYSHCILLTLDVKVTN